jgi:hypothetical protein
VRGDFATAEKWLLEAASVDRQLEPRWTLANFYFRRENVAGFWEWMREALAVSYGDRRPAFELCWRMTGRGDEILSRAIPDRREVVAAYLWYLLDTNRLDAALPVSLKLAAFHETGDRTQLLRVCDRFLDAQNADAARAVWQAIELPQPRGILHPDFEEPRLGSGFDWRLIDAPGVTHIPVDPPEPRLRISFNGKQDASCELARQILMLDARARYTLEWQSRSLDLGSISGVEWRLGDQRIPIPSSQDWRKGAATVVAPSKLTPLSLLYARPPGQVRAEGWIEVRGVTLRRE